MLDTFGIAYRRLSDADARSGNFVCGQTHDSGGGVNCDAVILPADSGNTIVKGLSPERYPAEFAGGIGDEGVDNLKKYVTEGGKLICLTDLCDLVIKTFGLPIKNVLSGLKRSEFYNPGSSYSLRLTTKASSAMGSVLR